MVKRKYINNSTRKKIFERDGGICQICGCETRFFNAAYDTPFDRKPKAGSIDHILPVSLGGDNSESNLRWTCRSCNCSRQNRMTEVEVYGQNQDN